MKLNDIPAPVWWLGGAALAAVAGYHLVKSGLVAVGQAVDPTSNKNAAYSGVNKVGEALTGDKDFSLGAAVYNLFHKDEGKDISSRPKDRNANGGTTRPTPPNVDGATS